jgi:hypothetical protein
MAKDKLANREPEVALVTNAVPEYLRKQEGEGVLGLDGMERSDLKMPRLSLCQSMTPQRKRTDPKYIEGLEEGHFFNTITGKIFGSGLKFVPLLWYKSRILFTPQDEGGGLLCRAEDAKMGVGEPGGECRVCPLSLWGKATDGKRKPPRCTLFHNYIILALPEKGLPGPESMVVMSLKSTGLDAATDLNALMQMRGARAAFAGVYSLASAEDSNAAGQAYYVPVIKNAGWVSEEMYKIAQSAFSMVYEAKSKGKLDIEPIEGEVDQTEPGEREM